MAMLLKVNERLDTLERKYLELSMEVKIKSIVINGLHKVVGENTLISAFNFLNVIDCNLLLDDIDVSYRIGAPNEAQQSQRNAPRSLIVIFKTIAKKRDTMRLKKCLKDSQAHKSVYMNDDLPVEVRQVRENMREIANFADEKGYTTKVSGNKLMVDGIAYHPHQLDLLPKDIQPEKVKTRKRGNGIAFQGETSFLLNFYPCDIIYKGMKYNCSEQAFQYLKLTVCKKEEAAHKIMLLTNPREIKANGDKPPSTKEWEAQKLEKMEEIVLQKFLQNPNLGRKLCDTGDVPLYESTTNQFWGCGLRLNSKQWFTGIYPGKNHMGLILAKVRTIIKEKYSPRKNRSPTTVKFADSHQETMGPTYPMMDDGDTGLMPGDNTSKPTCAPPRNQQADHNEMIGRGVDESKTGAALAGGENVEMDQSNVSMASSSSNTSMYRDFTSNGEIDIAKMRAWTLPSAKRKTRQWVNKQQRRGYTMNSRHSRPGNSRGDSPKHHSTPASTSPARKLRKTRTEMSHESQRQLKELGFDAESQYIRGLAHYNQTEHPNITNRRSSSNAVS